MSGTEQANVTPSPGGSPADHSKSFYVIWIPIAVSVLLLFGGVFNWGYSEYKARVKAEEEKVASVKSENVRLLREFLIPVQTKLKANEGTFKILNEQYRVPGWGVLESYYRKVRSDDPKKHALQFGYIADLVKRNSEMIQLLETYTPHRINAGFSRQSELFLTHAHAYVVRFRALPTLVESGGSLPRAEPFPEGFPKALDEEIAARQAKEK